MYLFIGDRHRAHRKLFNPAFSIAHMREIGMCQRIGIIKEHPFDRSCNFLLVPIFYEVAHKVGPSTHFIIQITIR